MDNMATRGACDRCGEPVRNDEDSTHLDEVVIGLRARRLAFCGFIAARHIRCSPSRQQFFGGSRTDTWTPERQTENDRAADVLRRAALDFSPSRETFRDAIKRAMETDSMVAK